MYKSDKKLQTNSVGSKARQTAHWDLDCMTTKQIEVLTHATNRGLPKKLVNMSTKPLHAQLEQDQDLLCSRQSLIQRWTQLLWHIHTLLRRHGLHYKTQS